MQGVEDSNPVKSKLLRFIGLSNFETLGDSNNFNIHQSTADVYAFIRNLNMSKTQCT